MRESTRKVIDEAVEVLREAGAREVYVFGSAAEAVDAPGSDIDFAVRGIPANAFYETVGKLLRTLTRDFDMIDLDTPTPFAEYLQRKGKLLRVA